MSQILQPLQNNGIQVSFPPVNLSPSFLDAVFLVGVLFCIQQSVLATFSTAAALFPRRVHSRPVIGCLVYRIA